VLIGLLVHRIGLRVLSEHLRSADPVWILAALMLFSLSHLVGSYQWWILLRRDQINITWKQTVSYYFVGLFFNNFFISSLGGDVFRMMDIRRLSKNGSVAVTTVLLDRMVGLFVLSFVAFLTAPWIVLHRDIDPRLRGSILILLAGWVLVLALLFNKRLARPFAWMIEKWIPGKITSRAKAVYRNIHRFGREVIVWRLLGISLIVQSARIMTHYFLGLAMGIKLSPVYFFLIIPVVAIMAGLPISLGGIGLREQTAVLLFGGLGVAASLSFSMEFLAYVIAILSSLPGGIVFMTRKKGIGSIEPGNGSLDENESNLNT
jgi:uncharacterized protein (TIRG00374 family)